MLPRRFRGSDGNGERFTGTGADAVVTLSYSPYINSSYMQYANYSSSIGTKFSGPATGYSPVKVVLDDGTIATNMTNYSSKSIGSAFPNSSEVFFIQSGKKLIFNIEINQG